jgi:nucleoid DNA-binding protein
MAAKTAKKPTKKPAAKGSAKPAAAAKPAKLSPAEKPRSKGEIYRTLAEHTGLGRKEVVSIFDTMSKMIETDLSNKGPGVFQIPGLMKVVRVNKPAQPARKNVPNPFKPGETMDVPAKKARSIVKVRPLKNLKGMV